MGPLAELTAEAEPGDHEDRQPEAEQRRDLGPQDLEADALEEHAAEDDDEVAQGYGVGDSLKENRHVLDREDEA